MSEEEVFLPKLGMQMQEATLVSWLKRPGEAVDVGDPLCLIMTDKVEMEIAAEVAGTLGRIEVEEDRTVPVGTVLAIIFRPD